MEGALNGHTVVLGVTGGIAAYKACDLVSRLKKEGACVRVVMTQNACLFVAPASFEALSGGPVYTQTFHNSYEIGHISLARSCDLLLIAPATANILAKMAGGIADDLLSTTCLAVTSPVLLAPAMNGKMWRHPATQENVRCLKERGIRFVGPGSGRLACQDSDVGRMEEPEEIVKAVKEILCGKKDLFGRRILVTAGPTRERLDPVRFISNHSSGKMGYAIAEAAARRGALVTLVSGPTKLEPPHGVELVSIESTADLHTHMMNLAPGADAVVQAAAPADFAPETVSDSKIKKTGGDLVLRLKPTPDVAKALGEVKRPGQVLVAFAAETEDLAENARKKLLSKRADFVVANDLTQPGAGFGVDTNQVIIVSETGAEPLPLMSKRDVANVILDRILGCWEKV